MQSTHCQLRVKNVVSAINGVAANEIKPGVADLSLSDDTSQKSITDAIEQAGYQVAGIESKVFSDPKTFTFKTNINCGGCVSQVKPALDASKGIDEWNVDTSSSDKTLTVKTTGVSAGEIIETVTRAGFKIETLNN